MSRATETVRGQVKCFPYRSARVGDTLLTVPRDSVKELEEQLAQKAGVSRDNHVVYEITQSDQFDQGPVYVLFSDNYARFGKTVVERSW